MHVLRISTIALPLNLTIRCLRLLCFLTAFCFITRAFAAPAGTEQVKVALDLVNIENDRVRVTVTPPAIKSDKVKYYMPKVLPGTYSILDYGRYLDEFKAFDASGKELKVTSENANCREIHDAQKLAKISYLVNDTYDSETTSTRGGNLIFSPAGTNIHAGKNFLLNLAGFAGYFKEFMNVPYQLTVAHPSSLFGATSLVDVDRSATNDIFNAPRYADLLDCPVMYAEPDIAEFKVGDMDVLISVYSPRNREINAKALQPELEKLIRAQKAFLGPINNTKRYTIILYVSSGKSNDATGFGALEHSSSTTTTFLESMNASDLAHIISHEFFHTVTPLNIHSKEIHDFDFDNPKMSQHLWLYEGSTEYFAHLCQVRQGLITEDRFFATLKEKMEEASYMDDTLSFTRMSRLILLPKMQDQFSNVYLKGALMSMCIDIIIREKSGGKRGLLSVIGELARKYGPDKPFEDKEFITEFTAMTYPEVGEFTDRHIVHGNPIDYDKYLERVGVQPATVRVPEPIAFLVAQKPYISVDSAANKVTATMPDRNNKFLNSLGVQKDDVLLEMNARKFDAHDISSVVMMGYGIREGGYITMKVERKGEVVELKAKATLNYTEGEGYKFTLGSKAALKNAWLKN